MKGMKRSMFVTTILMVVLLIVALSTATFAWYTANTQVGVNSTVVTSAASSAASLAIDKASNNASSNSEVTLTMSSGIMPMIPSAAPTGSTTYASFTGNDPYYFFQAPINNAGAFTAAGSGTVPAVISTVKNATGDASSGTGFYVINTDATNAATVNAAVTISTTAYTLLKAKPANFDENNTGYFKISGGAYVSCEGSESWAANTFYKANDTEVYKDLRVALFVDGTYLHTWSYVGGNGSSSSVATTYYGTIANAADSVSSLSHDYVTLASAATQSIGSIAAVSNKLIQVVAWFDGVGLEVDEASSAVFFTINFTVAA